MVKTTRSIVNGKVLTSYLRESEQSKLLNYVPNFLHEIRDLQELFTAEDLQIENINSCVELIKDNIFVQFADDETIKAWETLLGLDATETLGRRRNNVLSMLRGGSKLDAETVQSMVNAITGGSSLVRIVDNTIYVRVLPPDRDYDIDFDDIVNAINPRKPIHMRLVVERFYSTWGDIKKDYTTWGDVAGLESWQSVVDYVNEGATAKNTT